MSENFSSRTAFWVSAIGGAAGFGNVWRFPFLVYEYGGGAFFIPYLLGLIFVVIPICVVEYGVAQLAQGCTMASYNALGIRARSTGLNYASVLNTLAYYPLLMAWTGVYWVNSFKSELPWVVTASESEFCEGLVDSATCAAEALCTWVDGCVGDSLSKASTFFETEALAQPNYQQGIETFSWHMLLWNLATWAFAFGTVKYGKWAIGKVNYIAMTVPAIFLVLLTIIGSTLDGAGGGIKLYIGKFDIGVLVEDRNIWLDALAQGVFSMSAATGVMTVFSSNNPRQQNFIKDIAIVAVGDLLFAFLAGFAVFSVVGYLSYSTGVPITSMSVSGGGLAFITYPVGLSELGQPAGSILCVIFFTSLWCLGITSVLALVECGSSGFLESRWFQSKASRVTMLSVVCLVGWLISFLLCTDMGAHLLDCWDHFSSELTATFLILAISVSVGWLMGAETQIDLVGLPAYLTHSIGWLGGMAIGCLIAFSGAEPWIGVLIGTVIMLGSMGLGLYLTKDQDELGTHKTLSERWYNGTLYNIETLRHILNDMSCRDSIFRIYQGWSVVIKYIVPVVIEFMLFNAFFAKDTLYRMPDPEKRYPWWVFLVCSTGPVVLVVIIILGVIFPQYLEFMLPPQDSIVLVDLTNETYIPSTLEGELDKDSGEALEEDPPPKAAADDLSEEV